MKAYLCLYLLSLAASGCAARGEGGREFSGDSALAYVKTQLAFGPRIPNTEGHRKTGDWILAHLRATADSVEVQAFTHVTVRRDTLRLRNFIAHFRPGSSDRVLYLAHWDTRPKADRSSNLADQQRPLPGIAHAFVFWGFCAFGLVTINHFAQAAGLHLLSRNNLFGQFYFCLAALFGIAVAEEATSHADIVPINAQFLAAVCESERNLGEAERLACVGSVKNDIRHLTSTQRLCGLLA